MFCRKCGAQVKEDQKFCVNCGAKVEIRESQPGVVSEGPSSPFSPEPTPPEKPRVAKPQQSEPTRTVAPPGENASAVIRISPTPKREGKQLPLPWLWAGLAIIVLGVGGYFAHARLSHRQTRATPGITSENSSNGNSSIVSGSATQQAPTPPSTSSSKPTIPPPVNLSATDIRKVDFRNFDYKSGPLRKNIHVTNGEWKDAQTGDYFAVSKVVFGDLIGNGGDEAAVLTANAPGGIANLQQAELFIFAPSPHGPRLLQSLWSSDSGRGEHVDWGRITAVKASTGELDVSYSEGKCYACNDWLVTTKLRWNGNRFVPLASERKPFSTGPQVARTQSPASPNPIQAPTNHSPSATWGFGKQEAPQSNAPMTQTAVAHPGPIRSTPIPSPQSMMIQIPAGTMVPVQTVDAIDSGVNRMGDILHASLASPILVGSQIVVPQNADVYLRVFEVHGGERKGRPAELRLVLDHLVYRGQSYSLASSSFDVFGSARGKTSELVSREITRGEQVHIAPGAQMSFQLTQPVSISLAPGNPAR